MFPQHLDILYRAIGTPEMSGRVNWGKGDFDSSATVEDDLALCLPCSQSGVLVCTSTSTSTRARERYRLAITPPAPAPAPGRGGGWPSPWWSNTTTGQNWPALCLDQCQVTSALGFFIVKHRNSLKIVTCRASKDDWNGHYCSIWDKVQ